MLRIGVIVWLASDLMFFAALFAIYFTLRGELTTVWQEQSKLLDVKYAAITTTILVLSSVSCQLGVFAAERGDVKGLRAWFVVTYVMGAIFIGGQAFEYATLYHEGLTLATSGYGSAFFLATGFHALHVTGGLILFLVVLGRTFAMRRFTHGQAVTAIVVSYYWHFVDLVWVVLFSVIYLLQ